MSSGTTRCSRAWACVARAAGQFAAGHVAPVLPVPVSRPGGRQGFSTSRDSRTEGSHQFIGSAIRNAIHGLAPARFVLGIAVC